MLGVPSGLIGTTTPAATATAAAAAEAQESGGTSGGSGELGGPGALPAGFSEDDRARIDEGDRSAGGNRWPRQETLALLKIRSDMDVAFRDSSLKGPLWEEVSRKMAELGYHRNAKKCKEKFENVYKYHKRTKEGRTSKADGKTYRFFDQLEALENSSPSVHFPPPQPPMPAAAMVVPMQQAVNVNPNPQISAAAQVTVSSTPIAVSVVAAPQSFNSLINASFPPPANVTNPPQSHTAAAPPSHQHNIISTSFLSNSTSSSSSSSTSSDEDIERRHKRKRKWKDLFERLMKDVIEKQEELQKRFLETLEKRERDRMIREEAWRVQEMARINREHDLLVQERSMAAARESALVAFLQKMTDNNNNNNNPHPQNPITAQLQVPIQLPENPFPQHQTPPLPLAAAAAAAVAVSTPAPVPAVTLPATTALIAVPPKSDNGGENNYMGMGSTSSRWPKAEVQALINLRTSLDNKYQENGPKGPLWEEISGGMKKLGYNRNAKRCKEKWENINKYFKKVKESNKKRPEDSKTCPYFHQLEALYKEKAKSDAPYVKPENAMMMPIMARPEQQWPLPQAQALHREGENNDRDDDDDYDDDDDGDDEEDDESGYEIVTNKPSSVAGTTVE